MRATLKNSLKNIAAIALILTSIAMCPVTAQANVADVDAGVAVETTVEAAVETGSQAAVDTRAAAVATVETAVSLQYPEGTAYNNSTKYATQIKINGQTVNYTGYGCAGFAIMFEETCFGRNGSYTKTACAAASSIQVGDVVRVPSTTGGHTYVIIGVDATGATIAEANYNGAVHYGRHVTTAELAANEYVMRHV